MAQKYRLCLLAIVFTTIALGACDQPKNAENESIKISEATLENESNNLQDYKNEDSENGVNIKYKAIFASCREAIEAGAAPFYRGDPNYNEDQDKDGDGISCEIFFNNCKEARMAEAAPLFRGEPGYGAHLDRDNDGMACDPYPR